VFESATVYGGVADHLLLRGDKVPDALVPQLMARLRKAPAVHQRLRNVMPGELLTIAGLEFDAVHLPGATPGSMAYRLGDVVFSGDALWERAGHLTGPPWWMRSRGADAARYAPRLLKLEFESLATAHQGLLPAGRQWLKRDFGS
jgi:glyoxylase-like metal-dependent hydrolase (beta-lactamase superfamily II)